MIDNRLLTIAQDLIRIQSLTGCEEKIVKHIQKTMLDFGFDQAVIDEAGNVIGTIQGQGNYRILFDAHVDTVGVGDEEKWTVNPFAGEVDNGRIYGRGAADMKCALAAMLFAGANLIAQKESLPGTICISGTVSEEVAEGRCFETVLDTVKPDFVVIGEASELNLKIGQRGRAEIVLQSYGKSAHSSTPQLAVNAAEKLVDALLELRRMKLPASPLLGQAIMVLTDFISHPYPGMSVIPYQARATYDRRLLMGETEDEVLAEIIELFNKIKAENASFDVRAFIAEEELFTYTGYRIYNRKFFPAWELDIKHPLCQGTLGALRAAGLNPEITAYRFCTNGSSSAGKYGIPTIGFGPGSEKMAHTVDEYVSLEDLQRAAIGYQAMMKYSFCSGE